MTPAEAMRELREHLAELCAPWPERGGGRQASLAYRGPADFVLREGTEYRDVAPVPPGLVGAPRACYGNSIAQAYKRGWPYVEGYALHLFNAAPLAIPHAWNLDGRGRIAEQVRLLVAAAPEGYEPVD